MRSIAESFSAEGDYHDNRIHPRHSTDFPHHPRQHHARSSLSPPPDVCSPQQERRLTSSNKNNNKSSPIHIEGNVQRTPSEIQLVEDEAVADFRDYLMYERIVNGMMQRNTTTTGTGTGTCTASTDHHHHLKYQHHHQEGPNNPIVQRIIQTRARHPMDGPATMAMYQEDAEGPRTAGEEEEDPFFSAWEQHHQHQHQHEGVSSSDGAGLRGAPPTMMMDYYANGPQQAYYYPPSSTNATSSSSPSVLVGGHHAGATIPGGSSRNNSGVFLMEDL